MAMRRSGSRRGRAKLHNDRRRDAHRRRLKEHSDQRRRNADLVVQLKKQG